MQITFHGAAQEVTGSCYLVEAKDAAGNPLAANYVWSFTSGATPDTVTAVVAPLSEVKLRICGSPTAVDAVWLPWPSTSRPSFGSASSVPVVKS